MEIFAMSGQHPTGVLLLSVLPEPLKELLMCISDNKSMFAHAFAWSKMIKMLENHQISTFSSCSREAHVRRLTL